jgi:hypothetical protein
MFPTFARVLDGALDVAHAGKTLMKDYVGQSRTRFAKPGRSWKHNRYTNLYYTQEPTASANLDCEELKNGFVGVVAKGLGVYYVVSVKSVESLPTT